MKRSTLYTFIVLGMFLLGASACKNSGESNNHDHGVNDETGEAIPITNEDLAPDTSSIAHVHYVCPMACEGEKKYDEDVPCPVCEMKLKKIEHEGH